MCVVGFEENIGWSCILVCFLQGIWLISGELGFGDNKRASEHITIKSHSSGIKEKVFRKRSYMLLKLEENRLTK